jgi:uncharacterized protein YacL
MRNTAHALARVALSLSIAALALIQLLLTSAGGSVGLYLLAAFMAAIAVVFSQSTLIRSASVACVVIALLLAVVDYRAGIRLRDQLDRVRHAAMTAPSS